MNTEDPEWMNDWTVGVRLWVERCGEAILGPGEDIQPNQVPALSSPGLARQWLRWVDGENRVYVGFNDGRVVTISSLFEG